MIKIFGAACCFIGFIICIFFIIKITDGLNEGKLQLQEGRLKLKKYDNWFIRIFAGRKLEKGKQDLFDGEKKVAEGVLQIGDYKASTTVFNKEKKTYKVYGK